MRNLLGLPLQMAEEILTQSGYRVEAIETRSKKGVDGQSLRVIRATEIPAETPTMLLTFSRFKTSADGE